MMNRLLCRFGVHTRRLLGGILFCIVFAGPAHAQVTPASGYWWNPSQGGNGFVIEIQGNSMYMAGFLYATSGEATWVASVGPMTSATQYSGSLLTFSGGQTLTGAYKAATQTPNSAGNISITFTSNTKATLTWPGGTEQVQRLDFGPGGNGGTQPATNPQAGWWWNPSEGGRGFGIEVQGNSMYLAGYMYDSSGNPVWYLASGAMTDNGLFQGQWTQYKDGLTLTGAYKAPSLANGSVGSVTVQFSSTSSATLTLPDGRQIPITRLSFGVSGPTLTAFSPAAEAPASVLSVTGTNINPNATLSLNLSDSIGYSVNLPLTSVTSTGFTATVPPYFNPGSSTFGSGTVSVALTQTIGGASTNSNALSGFTIQKPPTAAGSAGTSTLALIQANLAEAQKLQTSIHGTAQDTPTVQAALATQISDLQTLTTNVQNVVQNGVAFSLGTVGGVNISVNQSNIADVDNLILATMQSLAAPPAGHGSKSAEAALIPGCMSAEATAYENAVLAGDSLATLLPLAVALVEAPYSSTACNNLNAFTLAYEIFGGAGNLGLGITDQAAIAANANVLPGASLFATVSFNADVAVGLNALQSAALAAQASSVQNAISNVTVLSQPAIDQLIAEATGLILANINHSQNFINTFAPPPYIPSNLPAGTYLLAISYDYNINGMVYQANFSVPFTNADGALFASAITSEITSIDSSVCANSGQGSCSLVITPWNGTTLAVKFNINSSVISGFYNFTLTKTG